MGGANRGAPPGTGEAALTRPGIALQMFGYLGGMTTYAVYHLASPPLVPLACATGSTWMLTAASALAALIMIAATVTSVRLWRTGRAIAAATGATADHRTAFLGLTGTMLNGLALAIILLAEVWVHVLDPCLPR
jgi:hypothetical protein